MSDVSSEKPQLSNTHSSSTSEIAVRQAVRQEQARLYVASGQSIPNDLVFCNEEVDLSSNPSTCQGSHVHADVSRLLRDIPIGLQHVPCQATGSTC